MYRCAALTASSRNQSLAGAWEIESLMKDRNTSVKIKLVDLSGRYILFMANLLTVQMMNSMGGLNGADFGGAAEEVST